MGAITSGSRGEVEWITRDSDPVGEGKEIERAGGVLPVSVPVCVAVHRGVGLVRTVGARSVLSRQCGPVRCTGLDAGVTDTRKHGRASEHRGHCVFGNNEALGPVSARGTLLHMPS